MTNPSSTDFGLLLRALAFAAHKHRDQRRKDKDASPYINHPIAAANMLANKGGVADPVVLSAALLHDTIEDTETTFEELVRDFGDEIAGIVREVTDDMSLPKEERKRVQLEHAAHLSPKARLVKLADKTCNLRDIVQIPPAHWSLERRQGYFDWARKVVDQIQGTNPGLEAAFDAAYAQRPRA